VCVLRIDLNADSKLLIYLALILDEIDTHTTTGVHLLQYIVSCESLRQLSL